MKKLVAVMAIVMACAAAGYAQDAGTGVGVEVSKNVYLSLMFPLEGLTLQALVDLDRVSNGSDDDFIKGGLALWMPVTVVGETKLHSFVQAVFESRTDYDAGYSAMVGIAPLAMIGESIGIGGKVGLQYEKHTTPEGEDAKNEVGLEGSVSLHWFF
ncbi:MAG: hypothetical protein JXB04_02180 [Kiritimatiellae bacterium]|nr:hypothetical protein [Kiritimatiellia bacterium]